MLFTLAIICAVATFISLLMGIMTMGKKEERHKKLGNKMMRLRVALQFSTLVLLLLAAAAASGS